MAATEMTPERAVRLGNRWRALNVATLVAAFVLLFAGLDAGYLVVLLLVAAYTGSEASDHYGWRRGYLARQSQQPARTGARLQVLLLPMEETATGYVQPFGLVLDGAPEVADANVAAAMESAMKDFARDCGGRTALVTNIPVDVVEPSVPDVVVKG